ncbi:MAG: TolC family protein [Bilophila sp.]
MHQTLSSPRLFLFCIVLALTGCANYPTADLTTAIIPAQRLAERFTLDTEWWKSYADPHLDRLMTQALERNINFARSAITINKALYRAKLLGEDLVPAFSADNTSSATRQLNSGTIERSFKSELGIKYELDLWQKLRNTASAQDWEYKATLEDRISTRLALVNAVADTYFELRYLTQSIAVTELSVTRYERLLALTTLRYDLGKAARIEPLQAEQSLLSTRNNLVSLRTQQAVAQQTLHDLLHLNPEETLALGNADLLAAQTAPINMAVPLAALAARPDIHAAEARLQAAF